MSGYEPPQFDTPIDLDLSRNEGRTVLEDRDFDIGPAGELIRRYPDTTSLARLLAARHDVTEDRVLVTAGGDDAIFRFLMWSRGARLVTTTPTFEMVARYSEQLGARLSEVAWWTGRLPIDELVATGGEVAVVVSPNNPTGSTIEESDLMLLADRFRVVLLDAAYAEFADKDLTSAALRLDNVTVVRTLSKAFGLAGLRVGYVLGARQPVTEIAGYGSPYAVSAVSAALAFRAVESGIERAERYARVVARERSVLYELLSDLGAEPLPSQGNFVLVTNTDPEALVSAAASRGVGLRRFPGRKGLERSVRIGLPGNRRDFDRLVRVLQAVLSESREAEVANVP